MGKPPGLAFYGKVDMFACKRHIAIITLVLVTISAFAALADTAEITGSIVGSEAAPGARGNWRYDMRISWDNGEAGGLDYLNLCLDDSGNCTADNILAYLMWDSPAGEAHFYDVNGAVYFDAELIMTGDPRLDISQPVIRFTPTADSQVRPASEGTAWFTFWSNLAPWSIDQPNGLLSEAGDDLSAFGAIEGVFPALPCNPVSSEDMSWGAVKSSYGR